jgi:putative membrane protein
MKKNILNSLFIVLLFTGFILAQDEKNTTDNNDRTTDKKVQMEKKNNANDNSFVRKAASGGIMEVELGRYAKDNAYSQEVKNFGDMMVTEHSKANEELMDILKNANMNVDEKMLPEHQQHVNKMTKMKGAEFDKAYMKMMVEDHKKDVKEFEKASKNERNTEVKNWAANTLPVLKQHLQKAQEINNNVNRAAAKGKNNNQK